MATARSVLLALLVAAALDASAAMLVSFDGHPMPQQLAAACKGAEAAAAAVQDNGVGAAAAALEQVLGAAEADGGRWLSHVDAGHVVISLIRGGEPLLGWVRILAGGQGDGPQTLFATDEGGTHVLGGSALEALAGASAHANVFSLPATGLWCPQLDECLEHLEETGLGMPIEYTRRDGVSCCEGLVDVLVARADFSLAPPALFLPHQPTPPPAVLAAFHLLLYEAGGSLTVSGSAREARSYRQRMGREHPLQTGGGSRPSPASASGVGMGRALRAASLARACAIPPERGRPIAPVLSVRRSVSAVGAPLGACGLRRTSMARLSI